MGKRRILIFVDWFLPGFKAGGPIRSIVNLIDHLAADFDFYIITGERDYNSKEHYQGIKLNQWNKINNSEVYYNSGIVFNPFKCRNLIRKVNPDIIYYNSMFSLPAMFLPLAVVKLIGYKGKIVLAPRGMLAKEAMYIKPLKKILFLKLMRIIGFFNNVQFHSTSIQESMDILRVLKRKSLTAPNFPNAGGRLFHIREKKSNELNLISIARISPEKNLLYALNILNSLNFPVQFNFFGIINDQKYWNKCQQLINSGSSCIKFNYFGAISPEDILPELLKNHFMFLPTLGENYGHVIIEAMSAGCPVIISDRTPWKNLQHHNAGWDIALDHPAKFIEILHQCYKMDQETYICASEQAFLFAATVIKDPAIMEKNRAIFRTK